MQIIFFFCLLAYFFPYFHFIPFKKIKILKDLFLNTESFFLRTLRFSQYILCVCVCVTHQLIQRILFHKCKMKISFNGIHSIGSGRTKKKIILKLFT